MGENGMLCGVRGGGGGRWEERGRVSDEYGVDDCVAP